jgi:hypothetical protein
MAATFVDPALALGRRQLGWFSLSTKLEYAERVVYWIASARTFALHPLLGAGLGNAVFFFVQAVPAIGYGLVDVLGAVGGMPGPFPNPKSLWFRLLAETGIAGFVFFLTYPLVAAACAWELSRKRSTLRGIIGLATLISLVAFPVEGFSLDPFALPYMRFLPRMTAGLWSRMKV